MVREGLRSLAERKLVQIQPARGTFVSGDTGLDALQPLALVYRRRQTTARQLVEARVVLESQAAALAALRATDDDLKALSTTVERMEADPSPLDHVRYDLAFHLLVARASHNPVIETMLGSVVTLAVQLMLRSVSDPEVAGRSHPYHRRACEAITARDPEAAAQAMRDHLEVADYTYGHDYDDRLDVLAKRELERLLGQSATLDELISDILADAPGHAGDAAEEEVL
jgi:GntR family transcriptional repressor for pyruvate dehydrogenase complex